MGLNIPEHIREWQRWQARQRRLQRWNARLSGRGLAQPLLSSAVRGENPAVLVAIDSRSPSGIASLHGLIDRIPALAVISSVHTPEQIVELLGGDVQGNRVVEPEALPRSLSAVVGGGHYLPAGAAASRLAEERGIPNVVVQHGLLTPFAPPLPPRAHLLAFSDADGAFWASNRSDIAWTVVGAQLLWEAGATPRTEPATGTPTYLGQLHGAELPRHGMARATTRFWRETGAVYRPHPSEADRLSRLQHGIWERQGMRIDRRARALAESRGPVVAAFSTGILESAAAGLPSWAFYPNPPRWLGEFWERYGIRRWDADDSPTPPPARPALEPAQAIADAVLTLAEGAS